MPDKTGPHILYAPYHAGSVFTEFANEAGVVAAINTPGALQDLILRRLPDNRAGDRSATCSSPASVRSSEITLASTPIGGNLLARLFSDNTSLLSQMLGSQSDVTGQSDWEAAKHLFSAGIKLISGPLPGKLAYVQFLWQAYKDFKDSAEALQDHHWKRALQAFIAGAAQMVTLGRLSLEASPVTAQVAADGSPCRDARWSHPQWSDVQPTAPTRTVLQRFEATTVALKDLKKDAADGTYLDSVSKNHYAAIAGKVYRVAKPGAVWRILNDQEDGPSSADNAARQLVIDPDSHTVHYGKAMSNMHNQICEQLPGPQGAEHRSAGHGRNPQPITRTKPG